MTELGAIPVRRGESDRSALEAALASLARGEALIIYPEGTRMRDDAVHEFQPGVGMLALRSGAPVIPVGLKGSDRVIHGGRPGLPVVRLKAGPAVDLSGLQGKKSRCTPRPRPAYERPSRRSMSPSDEQRPTPA